MNAKAREPSDEKHQTISTRESMATTLYGSRRYADYQCNTTWYSRGYQSNTVVYMVVDPPQGY